MADASIDLGDFAMVMSRRGALLKLAWEHLDRRYANFFYYTYCLFATISGEHSNVVLHLLH